MSYLNKTTGYTYDFTGVPDTETKSRTAKFPNVERQTITYAATVAIAATQRETIAQIAMTGDATVNATDVTGVQDGDLLDVLIKSDGSTRTATFGTNFKSSGTAAPTANKAINVSFRFDGTNFVEIGRSTAYTY